jgi:hypothetical protein
MSKLLLIELNEINFDFVVTYVRQGKLPVLGALIAEHGVQQTTSERLYEELEPWIQWVTAHTGLSYAEHRVFRLGDIADRDLPQIWEQLEEQGMKVGAVSPMNARNRTRAAAFFVPDPWTPTHVTGSGMLRRLHRAVCDAVNANAESKLKAGALVSLLAGLLTYARLSNYPNYLNLLVGSVRKRWLRALILDVLLGDIFIKLTARTQPDFASLFVNAGAHIQHHYMFCSSAYEGEARNPDWYVEPGEDPMLDVYEAYDRMIGQLLRVFPSYRLLIATGLRQVPHQGTTFYWRLRSHEQFLRKIGLKFMSVEPRMSRDFVIYFDSEQDGRDAEQLLESVSTVDGTALFEVDNRGHSLFVMLTYPHDIGRDFAIRVDGKRHEAFERDVIFVAIKNGEHDGLGYVLDTGARLHVEGESYPLKELPSRIKQALSISVA